MFLTRRTRAIRTWTLDLFLRAPCIWLALAPVYFRQSTVAFVAPEPFALGKLDTIAVPLVSGRCTLLGAMRGSTVDACSASVPGGF